MTNPITSDERSAMRARHTTSRGAVQRGVASLTDVPRLLDALDAAEAVGQSFKDALSDAYRPHIEQNRAYEEAIKAYEAEVARLREESASVRPDRETVARAIYAQEAQPIYDEVSERTVGSRPWERLTEEHRDHYLSRADEIINLWPGEPRAEAQAEALYDAADEYEARLPDGTGNGRAYNSYTVAAMLRDRADRLDPKGADRG